MKTDRLFLILMISIISLSGYAKKKPFEIRGDEFYKNGEPYRIISGSIHYSRIPHQKWEERLYQARAMGLNTICTYIFWNFHEQKDGTFDFTGDRDIRKFIETAGKMGLNVIVRPGPYVCAEWDLGGFPARLLADKNLRLRCMDSPLFLEETKKYINAVAGEIKDLQITNGRGPVIMVQVENEYGSFGNDHEYIKWLENVYRKAGFNVPFFTSDGPDHYFLHAGTSPSMLPVINFAANPQDQFAKLSTFRNNIPHMSGEWWVGWLTHWGEDDWKNQNEERQKRELKWMLENDKNINMFMFHGGTNFSFWAGANHQFNAYWADITSYDYGAPLTEGGNVTPEFLWMREMLSQYQNKGEKKLPPVGKEPKTISIENIKLDKTASLFDQLPVEKMIKSKQLLTMEQVGQDFGYILYKTTLDSWISGNLTINDVHDYAYVFLDGKLIGEVNRTKKNWEVTLPKNLERGSELAILVEAMGRINFGPKLFDLKGITDRVRINNFSLMNWEIYPLPMDQEYIDNLRFTGDHSLKKAPAFFKGEFHLDEVGDTYLDMRKWKKGVVWINGHNLGRYWNIGPQYDLYVPDCWLRKGKNEILIFDGTNPGNQRSVSSQAKRISSFKGEIDMKKLDNHNGITD